MDRRKLYAAHFFVFVWVFDKIYGLFIFGGAKGALRQLDYWIICRNFLKNSTGIHQSFADGDSDSSCEMQRISIWGKDFLVGEKKFSFRFDKSLRPKLKFLWRRSWIFDHTTEKVLQRINLVFWQSLCLSSNNQNCNDVVNFLLRNCNKIRRILPLWISWKNWWILSQQKDPASVTISQRSTGSRASVSLKRQLFQKFQHCQFQDALTGRRCTEKFQLEMGIFILSGLADLTVLKIELCSAVPTINGNTVAIRTKLVSSASYKFSDWNLYSTLGW